MTTYEKFRRLGIDLAPVGMEQGDSAEAYFCTPKGAKIIGRTGVDGIHFCFVRGFGETVFAVSPMNLPGSYVHPVAKSFEDLLKLLLSCGGMDAIEQAHGWDEAQFEEFLKENSLTDEQSAVLDTIKEKLSITPMENPFSYIKTLQSGFDYGKIKYSPEYYDPDMNRFAERKPPEWKVTYDGSFWSSQGRRMKEIAVGKTFTWGDELWHVPAIYVCGKGLVIDFCIEVEPERIKSYIDKWDILGERSGSYTKAEEEQMRSENPLNVEFKAAANVNGKTIRSGRGCGVSWIPAGCLNETDADVTDAESALDHYGLDKSRGWAIRRCSFEWSTKRAPEIKSLKLELERWPTDISGISFTSPKPDDVISFTHPITGAEHKLTVCSCEAQEIDTKGLPDESMEYPSHYTMMTYTLSPEVPDGKLVVRDCAEGDRARIRAFKSDETSTRSEYAAAIGIIGGADGPTAIFVSGGAPSPLHVTMSSVRFEVPENIEWRIIFREKLVEDTSVTLW